MPNTFTLIASSTVGAGGAASISFSSIPSTYTDLCLVSSLRADTSLGGGSQYATGSFNGSTANFSWRQLAGLGAGGVSSSSGTSAFIGGALDDAASTASTFTNSALYVPNYAGSTNKSYSVDSVMEVNAGNTYMPLIAGLWSNIAAINAITLTCGGGGNFVQYSTAYLYGVKNA